MIEIIEKNGLMGKPRFFRCLQVFGHNSNVSEDVFCYNEICICNRLYSVDNPFLYKEYHRYEHKPFRGQIQGLEAHH